jgi:hypothetical protein
MGNWSHHPFGNDTANDWAYDLEGTKDFHHCARAIQAVLAVGEDDYLDADVAAEAVGAAEVLAKALGHGTQRDAYTEKVEVWLASIVAKPSRQLLDDAQRALARILGPESELRDLWEEGHGLASWEGSMHALQAALRH